MNVWRRPTFWVVIIAALAVVLGLALGGCTSQPEGPSERQQWIDAHPTHAGPNGECVEDDGELCDDDPFDLDDLYESKGVPVSSRKPSPRPMLTANQPKPKASTRAPAPPAPVKTTRRR